MNTIKNEPALTVSFVAGTIAAALVQLVASFVTLTPEQQSALTTFLVILVTAVGGYVTRRYVTPVHKLQIGGAAALGQAAPETGGE